jgi:hypothetical protein
VATKPEKHDIRLTVCRKTNHDIGRKTDTFTANVVYMVEPESTTYNPNDAGVRNPNLDSYSARELRHLGSLAITAYRSDGDAPTNQWYGYDLEYHEPFRVGLRQLEFMVKFMRKTQAKMDKLEAQWGYPRDLADYCARAVVAIGGNPPFGIYHRDLQINGTHYRWVDVDGLRAWLDKPADA